MEPTPASAPMHPCDRCGAFSALFPWGDGRYCAGCLERVKHPIERGGVTVGSLLSSALHLTRTVGLKVLLLGLCVYGPLEFLRWRLPTHHAVTGVVAEVASLLVDAVVLGLAIDSVRDEDRSSVPRAVARTLRRIGPMFLVLFLALLIDAVAAVFLVVPGIICMLSFSLVVPMALFERGSAPATLRGSWDRMKGHRLTTFAAFLVSGLPGLALLFAMIAWQVVWIFGHHGRLPPGGLPVGARVLNVAMEVALLVTGFITAAVYVKTRPEAREVLPARPVAE